jgi:hypothetical protein
MPPEEPTPRHRSARSAAGKPPVEREAMDVLYFYKKTEDDFEIRHSLRSFERYARWARKIWIYGDRPDFLTLDTSVAEHVPDSFGTAILGIQPPVRNTFLMLFLSSLIPELTPEFVWCSDDHFLLKDYGIEEARKVRYLEDLREVTRPALPGLWKEQLWRTHDFLTRLGYPGWNFESHTPIYFTKRRVLNAYCDLRDYVTNDRWYGLMGASAILNHALKHDGMEIHSIKEEGSRIGWHGKVTLTYEDVVRDTAGKTFLYLGDGILNEVTRRFLSTQFPDRSRFEAGDTTPIEPAPAAPPSSGEAAPAGSLTG